MNHPKTTKDDSFAHMVRQDLHQFHRWFALAMRCCLYLAIAGFIGSGAFINVWGGLAMFVPPPPPLADGVELASNNNPTTLEDAPLNQVPFERHDPGSAAELDVEVPLSNPVNSPPTKTKSPFHLSAARRQAIYSWSLSKKLWFLAFPWTYYLPLSYACFCISKTKLLNPKLALQ